MTDRPHQTPPPSSPQSLSGLENVAGGRNAAEINKVLFTIADAVNTTLNLHHLYATIHQTLATVLDAKNFFIAIVDKHKNILHFPYFVDSTDDDFAPIKNFDTKSSLTGLVVLEKRPILLTSAQLRQRAKENGIWGPEPLSWMGVPLIIRDEVIGIIAVQSYIDKDAYSIEDLEILSAVSHQTAIAIDRKQSLDDLKTIKERQTFALRATGSGIWDWNIATNEIFLDDNHYIMAGYKPREYPSTRSEWKKRVHPDDISKVSYLLDQTRSGATENYRSEYRFKRKSGDWMWILSQGKIVSWTKEHKPARFIGTHTDISQRKRAEDKLRQSEKTYRNIFLNAQIGLFRLRLNDLKLVECNEAIALMLGYADRQECMLKLSATDAYASAHSLRKVLRHLKKFGEIRNDIAQFRRKDGSLAWFRCSAKSYIEENYIEGVVEDITEFKIAQEEKLLLQERLERSKKMEALGLLAGSVAHDLNNILSGIISYPELMLLKLDSESELVAPLTAIKDSGTRAATVVNDLLTIARSAASIKEVACLNSIISDYLNSPEFLRHKKSHQNLIIQTRLEAQVSNILCSPVHITKSIMNLVTNAVEAIGGKGTITITTTNKLATAETSTKSALSHIALIVQDSGPGISKKDLKHIFEPFYTQKMMGTSGTGLGLTVVWNTMEDHNGEIAVESDSNGTSFTLLFPTTMKPASKQPESYDIMQHMGNGQHILIVDDEPQLRDIASQLLTSLGYICTDVESGEQAIEYLKSNSADLILLDMLMQPGLNGRETYEEIIKTHPQQKAILASGYSESKEVELALKKGVGAFVKKPYSIKQLSIAVKEQLST